MACHECERARQTAGACRWYCEGCIYCGARLIQWLRSKPRAKQRQLEMLEAWVNRGHSRAELLRLVLGVMPLEPLQLSGEQDRPRATKRR